MLCWISNWKSLAKPLKGGSVYIQSRLHPITFGFWGNFHNKVRWSSERRTKYSDRQGVASTVDVRINVLCVEWVNLHSTPIQTLFLVATSSAGQVIGKVSCPDQLPLHKCHCLGWTNTASSWLCIHCRSMSLLVTLHLWVGPLYVFQHVCVNTWPIYASTTNPPACNSSQVIDAVCFTYQGPTTVTLTGVNSPHELASTHHVICYTPIVDFSCVTRCSADDVNLSFQEGVRSRVCIFVHKTKSCDPATWSIGELLVGGWQTGRHDFSCKHQWIAKLQQSNVIIIGVFIVVPVHNNFWDETQCGFCELPLWNETTVDFPIGRFMCFFFKDAVSCSDHPATWNDGPTTHWPWLVVETNLPWPIPLLACCSTHDSGWQLVPFATINTLETDDIFRRALGAVAQDTL